jgi:hypothetical protein
MVADVDGRASAGRDQARSGAALPAGAETASAVYAASWRRSAASLALLAALARAAHPGTAVAQNAASIQIAAVVVELPAERALPAHLQREAQRAAQRAAQDTLAVEAPRPSRREELAGGLAAMVTEQADRKRLRVRLEYIAN